MVLRPKSMKLTAGERRHRTSNRPRATYNNYRPEQSLGGFFANRVRWERKRQTPISKTEQWPGSGPPELGQWAWTRTSSPRGAGKAGPHKSRGGQPVLRQNPRGQYVRWLQILLNHHHAVQPVLTEDGIFGPKTLAAVTEFSEMATAHPSDPNFPESDCPTGLRRRPATWTRMSTRQVCQSDSNRRSLSCPGAPLGFSSQTISGR